MTEVCSKGSELKTHTGGKDAELQMDHLPYPFQAQ